MNRYKLLVLSNPAPGQDEEYNTWYNDVHIADVLAIPAFTSCKRFRIVGAGRSPDDPCYAAIYEFNADDPDSALAELSARVGTEAMPIPPAFDMASVTMMVLDPL